MKNLWNDGSRIIIKCIIFKLIHIWPQLFGIYFILGCRCLQGRDSVMFLCGPNQWNRTLKACLLKECIIEWRETCHWWKKNPPSITSICWWGQRQSASPELFCKEELLLIFLKPWGQGVDSKAVVPRYGSVAQWQPWWNFHLSSTKMTEVRAM